MAEVTIYHNPNCGASRNTLAAIRAAGIEPEVVESQGRLDQAAAGKAAEDDEGQAARHPARPRHPGGGAGLTDPKASDETILAAMVASDPGRTPDRGHRQGRGPVPADGEGPGAAAGVNDADGVRRALPRSVHQNRRVTPLRERRIGVG